MALLPEVSLNNLNSGRTGHQPFVSQAHKLTPRHSWNKKTSFPLRLQSIPKLNFSDCALARENRDSLWRLTHLNGFIRSFMSANSTVKTHEYAVRTHRLSSIADEALHASQVAVETHKRALLALEVIKVQAPVDIMVVQKLRDEGWMGTIEVVACPYSPDDERIRLIAYTHGITVVNPYKR